MNWYKQSQQRPQLRQIANELNHLLNNADLSLSDVAQRAITSFVGHEPMSQDKSEFDAFGLMNSDMLEEAYSANPGPEGLQIRQDLQQAFAPVKEYLQRTFGNTVPVHRRQAPLQGNEGKRNVLSWTLDPKFAEFLSGAVQERPVSSDAEINQLVQQYIANGRVDVGTTSYRKDYQYDGIDIYHGNQLITGIGGSPEDLRKWLQEERDEAREYNIANDKKRQQIMSQEAPLDDVVWATNRANQWELIILNR